MAPGQLFTCGSHIFVGCIISYVTQHVGFDGAKIIEETLKHFFWWGMVVTILNSPHKGYLIINIGRHAFGAEGTERG